MAMLNVIRRTSSRILPLAIQRASYHHSSTVLSTVKIRLPGNTFHRPSFLNQQSYYSTKTSSDASLLKLIQSEIQCAVESQEDDQGEEIPQGFPFKIEDHPGQQTITLTREYQGETITAEVYMPNLITGQENDDNGDEEEGRGNQSSIPFVVRVSKRSGPHLEFGCTAYPDEITIESMAVKDPNNSEDQIAYEGPDFSDLDENLQKAFHKYLEIRGIKASTTNYLHGYMLDKDGREYVRWLNTVQKFLKP